MAMSAASSVQALAARFEATARMQDPGVTSKSAVNVLHGGGVEGAKGASQAAPGQLAGSPVLTAVQPAKQRAIQQGAATTAAALRPVLEHDERLAALRQALHTPTQLRDFELGRVIGTGSFGQVRIAVHVHTQATCVIKSMSKSSLVSNGQVQHVLQERDLQAQVTHAAFAQLLGSFQDAHRIHLVQEFVPGGELFTLIKRSGRLLSEDAARFYTAQIVLALEHLHSLGIVFRDLKPENLLVDGRGYIKLTDFGFAKQLEGQHTFTLCGTPEYLAPEVILNMGHSTAVDWWALGVLLYEMQAGHPPFYDAADTTQAYKQILDGRYKAPAHWGKLLADLVKRLLQVDPAQRLGNLAGGAQDIKDHPWFRSIDWFAMAERTLPPPHVPAASGDHSANFEDFSGAQPLTHDFVLTEEQQELFCGI